MTADAPCRLGVAAVVLLVIACGDGSRDVADASLDGSADLGPDVATTRPSVAAPMPPAPTEPTSFDCPTGWQPFETEHGAQACHPWPGGEPPECAAHEMPLPGEGCVPISSPCASDGWAADLPAEGVLYVRSGAPAGGDGTRDRPFDRIGAATSLARSGDVVAVARGAYDESPSLREGVTLWGACVGETIVRGRPRFTDASIDVEGRDVVVRGVTIASLDLGLRVHGDASVHLDEVDVRADGIGVQVVPHGALRTTSVRVVGEVAAIDVDGGARVEIARSVLTGTTLPGLNVAVLDSTDPVELRVEDATFLDNAVGAITVRELPGSTVAIARVAVVRGGLSGVYLDAANGTLEDVSVLQLRRLRGPGTLPTAIGIVAVEGSELRARRVLVDGVEGSALMTLRGTLDVDGLVVRSAHAGTVETAALHVESARATLRHVHVEQSVLSIAIGARGSEIVASDVTAIDLAPAEGDIASAALNLIEASSATIDRLRVVSATSTATSVSASRLDLRDATIEGTRRSADIGIGYAMQVIDGGEAVLDRIEVTRTIGSGISVVSATARLTDVSVTDTSGIETRDGRGVGIMVLRGEGEGPPDVRLERVRVRDSVLDGVLLYGDGTLSAIDLEVDGIGEARCGSRPCTAGAGGRGITCANAAHMTLERFSVARAVFAGLVWADGCVPVARDGLVRDSAIGLVNDATVDLGSAPVGVEFEGCEVDYQTTALDVAPPDELLGL